MYIPRKKILDRYADVLVSFALWGGKGIRSGDVVCLQVSESAKPMLESLIKSVLKKGGHPILMYFPEGYEKLFFKYANMKQIRYAPKKYMLERIKACDHFLSIISTDDKQELKSVKAKNIMARRKSMKFYMDARREKENKGKLSWTLGLFATEAMAEEASMSLRSYWNQIIKACFLDNKNPVRKWRSVFEEIEAIKSKLNSLNIEVINIKGKDIDLEVRIGRKRKWVGGSGRNIPSFEIFTSPDWRGTNGHVKFSEPLYRYGNLISDIELVFKRGRVVEWKARKGKDIFAKMLKMKNADKIGEFSLTDKRFSRINKFMAETLFDENVGGKYGNFHIALGMAYKDTYSGDRNKLEDKEWRKLGFNIDCIIHTDIVSTTDRVVTANLSSGKKIVLYKDGKFTL